MAQIKLDETFIRNRALIALVILQWILFLIFVAVILATTEYGSFKELGTVGERMAYMVMILSAVSYRLCSNGIDSYRIYSEMRRSHCFFFRTEEGTYELAHDTVLDLSR